jgi:phosphatidylserine/phosphatidylglycerophosphate/cardiolipin synthase-like enzyme
MTRPYVSTYFSPKQGAAAQVVGFIDHCTGTLDIAVYALTHNDIAEAIARAHSRGVVVRVLTDHLMSMQKGSDDEKLKAVGIDVRKDTQDGAMHHKFCIGDAHTPNGAVITGSFNWSVNADKRNAENFVIIRLAYAVKKFKREFDRIWKLNAV